jgi:Ni/Fe-hydrogenase subunit HybB-like protein
MEKLETVEAVKEKIEIRSFGEFWRFFLSELKPKGNPWTPFNLFSGLIMVLGFIFIIYRFVTGLSPTTNLSQEFPWGLWKAAVVNSGVAFAAGGYTLAFIVYILGMERYRPMLRETVLFAFLAYVFYAGALTIELGRWHVFYNPFIGNKYGVSSVLFIVAWHFMLYIATLALEFSPAAAEWVGFKRVRKIVGAAALGSVVFGVMLSIHHQAGLGAMFTMTKGKLHPLWFTEFIPVLYFISSIYAGPAVMIVVSSITQKLYAHRVDEEYRNAHSGIVLGLAKMCAATIFAYLFLQFLLVHHEHDLSLINTRMGFWWLIEVGALGLIPMFLFIHGIQQKNLSTINLAAVLALIGVLLNRLNNVFIAYNWYLPLSQKYYPTWQEVIILFTIIFIDVWVFRFVINRMHILSNPPVWARMEKH